MTRSFPILVLMAMGVSLLAHTAPAATYYVDFSAGSDTNTGTATGAAWQHCPGDGNATGIPASTVVTNGDSVFFKGGVAYVTEGVIPSSGVTYDGNSSGGWGTGRAVFTDNNHNPGGSGFTTSTLLSNTVFRSLIFTNFGGSATLPVDGGSAVPPNGGYGILLTGGAQNVIARDCIFTQLGYWYNTKPMDANSLNGFGFRVAGDVGSGITITNCAFSRAFAGVSFATQSTTNVLIVNSTFTDSFVWGVVISPARDNGSVSGVDIHGSTFTDFYQLSSQWTGYLPQPHIDGIFCFVGGGPAYTNITWVGMNIYKNLFSSASYNNGTAAIYFNYGPGGNIYNNVFNQSGMANGAVAVSGGITAGSTPQQVNVFNNSFVDYQSEEIFVRTESSTWAPGKVTAYNNVFAHTYGGTSDDFINGVDEGSLGDAYVWTNWLWNFNLYKKWNYNSTADSTHPLLYWGVNGAYGYKSLSQMHSEGGAELNGLVGDPLYTNGLHLSAGSPAIGAGTNLTALALPGLNSDFDGNPRPATGAWDIGAYAGTTKPPLHSLIAPPGNLRLASP